MRINLTIPWNQETKLILMIIVAVILVIAILAFIIELTRHKRGQVEPIFVSSNSAKAKEERVLTGLSVNTKNVHKEYMVGEEFVPDGLVVTAHYNLEPFAEVVEGYEMDPVDMTQVGMPIVTVKYGGKSVGFQITINPVVVEEQPNVIYVKSEPVVIEEESYEGGKLRYNRSFTARLIQSDDEVKHWYTEIKNNLLSYKKVKSRISWKRDSFRFGREPFARLGYRGKTLCIYLPLNPEEFEDTVYKVEDVSDNNNYEDTPCMYRIKNARRAKYAMELITLVAEKYKTVQVERETEDYYVPYEGIVELINKGLIKRNVKTKEDEAFFENKKVEEKI